MRLIIHFRQKVTNNTPTYPSYNQITHSHKPSRMNVSTWTQIVHIYSRDASELHNISDVSCLCEARCKTKWFFAGPWKQIEPKNHVISVIISYQQLTKDCKIWLLSAHLHQSFTINQCKTLFILNMKNMSDFRDHAAYLLSRADRKLAYIRSGTD